MNKSQASVCLSLLAGNTCIPANGAYFAYIIRSFARYQVFYFRCATIRFYNTLTNQSSGRGRIGTPNCLLVK
jgi:hypothetical protein